MRASQRRYLRRLLERRRCPWCNRLGTPTLAFLVLADELVLCSECGWSGRFEDLRVA